MKHQREMETERSSARPHGIRFLHTRSQSFLNGKVAKVAERAILLRPKDLLLLTQDSSCEGSYRDTRAGQIRRDLALSTQQFQVPVSQPKAQAGEVTSAASAAAKNPFNLLTAFVLNSAAGRGKTARSPV